MYRYHGVITEEQKIGIYTRSDLVHREETNGSGSVFVKASIARLNDKTTALLGGGKIIGRRERYRKTILLMIAIARDIFSYSILSGGVALRYVLTL